MKIAIFHASAGYGHQKIAEVIHEEITRRANPEMRSVVIDALAYTPALFSRGYKDSYYYSVKYTPQLWGSSYENTDKPFIYQLIKPLRYAANRIFASKLLRYVLEEKPDVIICTHFLSAQVFSEAKRKKKITAQIIVVITDYFPHTFWVNEGTDTYWVMADETAADLKRRGVPTEKICVGGIPVGSQFAPTGKKTAIRSKFQFDPNRFTLLLTTGSFGFGPMAEILRGLEEFSDRIQCFVVCGNNKTAYDQLSKLDYGFPCKVFGFVNFMDELMEASDLMIAKPGGSTTTESLAKGIPMIVMSPIPGQETRNVKLLKDRNAAFFIEEYEQIVIILRNVLNNPELYQNKVKAIRLLAKPKAVGDLVDFIALSIG